MRAWSLLLVCGLRLHRCSDRAVAAVAVAGLRPARRRCPAASPRPCSRSSSRIPPTPAGPRSCAPPPAAAGSWRWPAGTSCRCWWPGPWPPRSRSAPWAPCARSKTSPLCLPAQASADPVPCTSTAPCPGSCTAHPQLQELTGNPGETADLPRLGLHRLPAGEIPLLPGLACVLAGYDGPPNPDADPASSWPGSQRHCLPRRS